MDLLHRFGGELSISSKTEPVASPLQTIQSNTPTLDTHGSSSAVGQMATPLLALVISLVAGYIG